MKSKSKSTAVPQLRFPEFRESEGWDKEFLSKFLTESLVKGNSGDTAKKLTVKLWGKGVFKKEEGLKGSKNTQYFRRKSGQFIYSKLDFLNQAFGIVPHHLDGYESTVDLPCLDIDGLNPNFLLEYVKRNDFYKKYGEIADGGRKAKRIQVETFLAFPIFTPRPKEQQKISDCLSSIDELIKSEQQKLDNLETHKKGLMQNLFPPNGKSVPQLRFPEFAKSADWKVKSLDSVCYMQAGKFVSASQISESNDDGKFPCFGGNGLRGYTNSFNHSGKYPLIGRQGALCGNIVFAEGDFYATEHALVVSPKPKIEVDWLYYNLVFLNLNQYATGQAQPGLSVDGLKQVLTAAPVDPKEQREIANLLLSIDRVIVAQNNKLEELKNLKQALIQKLFPTIDKVMG